MRPLTLLAALLAPSAASAFCGTYVGGAGSELYNAKSEIVVVREGTRTTLTLVNDVESTTADFAMLIPVPIILGEEDVRVIDPEAIATIDQYTQPRLVEYTCENMHGASSWDNGSFGQRLRASAVPATTWRPTVAPSPPP